MQHEPPRSALLAREWLVKAQHDLEGAERAILEPPLTDLVAFHAQQAAEKALKGYLAWRDLAFERTHELVSLLSLTAELDPDFASLEPMAALLTPYAIDPRYPGRAELTVEEAAEALDAARHVVGFVAQRLPPEARP